MGPTCPGRGPEHWSLWCRPRKDLSAARCACWARKAAGEKIQQPRLPEAKREYSLSRWSDPYCEEAKAGDEQAKVKPEQITVSDELTNPHELVVRSLPLLRQANELRENLLERESCLSITVQTHALKDWALSVMDTLLKALEARGYSIEVTPPRHGQPDSYGRRTDAPSKTLARAGETVIQFGIHEGTDHVLVNGKRAFENGRPTGLLSGRPLPRADESRR